jgi:hypothetical protein
MLVCCGFLGNIIRYNRRWNESPGGRRLRMRWRDEEKENIYCQMMLGPERGEVSWE